MPATHSAGWPLSTHQRPLGGAKCTGQLDALFDLLKMSHSNFSAGKFALLFPEDLCNDKKHIVRDTAFAVFPAAV